MEVGKNKCVSQDAGLMTVQVKTNACVETSQNGSRSELAHTRKHTNPLGIDYRVFTLFPKTSNARFSAIAQSFPPWFPRQEEVDPSMQTVFDDPSLVLGVPKPDFQDLSGSVRYGDKHE